MREVFEMGLLYVAAGAVGWYWDGDDAVASVMIQLPHACHFKLGSGPRDVAEPVEKCKHME